jgi:hypothetical protein
MRYDRVMDFSGGISAFVLPMMRRQSPEVTAFTLPLSHPDAPVFVAMIAAISFASARSPGRAAVTGKEGARSWGADG